MGIKIASTYLDHAYVRPDGRYNLKKVLLIGYIHADGQICLLPLHRLEEGSRGRIREAGDAIGVWFRGDAARGDMRV